jgi:hypothetical protein
MGGQLSAVSFREKQVPHRHFAPVRNDKNNFVLARNGKNIPQQ